MHLKLQRNVVGLTVGLFAVIAVACGSDAADSPTATQSSGAAPTATAEMQATSTQPTADPTQQTGTAPTPDPLAGAFSMGGADLGGTSDTEVLAAQLLRFTPETPVEWVAHQVVLEAGDEIEHEHEFAFVYAVENDHELVIDGTLVKLEPGVGRGVPERLRHKHRAVDSPTTFWEIRLAPLGSRSAIGVDDPRLVFRSGPLAGIPELPAAAFVLVTIPPGGQTSVHTHPGPEFIYQYEGVIDYQNEFKRILGMEPGAFEGIPATTAVQKRNESGEDAVFLSWFLVDTDQPFASPARFDEGQTGRGRNLALPENGGSVSEFSSSFGRGTADSPFGANSAIDGDPGTEWSSFNDGDDAFIEISLAGRTRITSLGFWTRTMGTSAEIFSFSVVTDEGETQGPFILDGAAAIKYFDTDFVATKIRFAPSESSGGNVGAVEIEIYGEPAS